MLIDMDIFIFLLNCGWSGGTNVGDYSFLRNNIKYLTSDDVIDKAKLKISPNISVKHMLKGTYPISGFTDNDILDGEFNSDADSYTNFLVILEKN
jgi:hypothetical protein